MAIPRYTIHISMDREFNGDPVCDLIISNDDGGEYCKARHVTKLQEYVAGIKKLLDAKQEVDSAVADMLLYFNFMHKD